MYYWLIPLIIISSYFIGNVHFAVVLSRLKHTDIRALGSGNPGTMNMMRNFGVGLGALTMLLDVLKATLPAVISYYLLRGLFTVESGSAYFGYYIPGASKLGYFIGGFPVVLGHMFPAINRFKGGKGVAASIGVFLAANPLLTLAVFVFALIFMQLTNQGAITSFICVGAMAAAEIIFAAKIADHFIIYIISALIFIIVLCAHHSNIKRILNGTEAKTYLWKPKRLKNKDNSPESNTD